MRKYIFLSLIIVSLMEFSCQKNKVEERAVAQKVVVQDIPDDIRVPSQMWKAVEAEPVGFGEKKEVISDEDGKLNRHTILFSPITVILTEHNPNVLSHSEVRIELPRGGGKIDLSKYMGDNLGSFFVRFEWPEWTELSEVKSFYVSRAKKRKLDGDVYGVGCNKFLEMTKRLAKINSQLGIKVNTTRERHISALGGHFVFSNKNGRQIFLSQVTFIDSTKRSLFCEELKIL